MYYHFWARLVQRKLLLAIEMHRHLKDQLLRNYHLFLCSRLESMSNLALNNGEYVSFGRVDLFLVASIVALLVQIYHEAIDTIELIHLVFVSIYRRSLILAR